jgi:hypothetical protein
VSSKAEQAQQKEKGKNAETAKPKAKDEVVDREAVRSDFTERMLRVVPKWAEAVRLVFGLSNIPADPISI